MGKASMGYAQRVVFDEGAVEPSTSELSSAQMLNRSKQSKESKIGGAKVAYGIC